MHAALLGWFARMGRDLPWRRTRDPYAILVSEIMLQQTQVERVKPRYEQFLDAFPTLARLAAAPLADVIRVWAGLGYNRRAVRLHQIAVQVTKRPDGRLPDTPDALRQLDGLGSYTANAVACFAFGQQVPVVDTNVRRVLGRVFADVIGLDPPAGHSLDGFASQVLPAGQAYAWNSALMDLGATVCTARNPDHAACPLAPVCVGRSLLPSRATRQRAAEPGLPPQVRSDSAVRPYNRQPFEQTTRFFRGRIVDRLRALPHGGTLGLDALGAALRPDYLPDEHRSWVAGLVERLRRDGLVATCDDSGTLRVSLP